MFNRRWSCDVSFVFSQHLIWRRAAYDVCASSIKLFPWRDTEGSNMESVQCIVACLMDGIVGLVFDLGLETVKVHILGIWGLASDIRSSLA